jgi:hypothetical protein
VSGEKNIPNHCCSYNFIAYRHHLYPDKLGIDNGGEQAGGIYP